jgi:hypothetical protein
MDQTPSWKDYRDQMLRELDEKRAYVRDRIDNPTPGSTVHDESGWIGLLSEINQVRDNLRKYA